MGDKGPYNHFLAASRDPYFAQNVLIFLNQYNLSGIDVDWEYDLSEPSVTHLVAQLSSTLRPEGNKSLWSSNGGSDPLPSYNMQALTPYLDQINLMSYGRVDIEVKVDAYVELRLPKEKIIVGVSGEWPSLFDSADTVPAKCEYVKSNNLAGVMLWRVDNDYATSPDYPTYSASQWVWKAMRP